MRSLASFILKEKKLVDKELSLYFVGKRKISLLHAQFFDDPSPTDCISFPFNEPLFLGEIFICPQIAKEYDPEKPHEETSLYIIHGILHLLGYDDIESKERKKMVLEQSRLFKLAKNNHTLVF